MLNNTANAKAKAEDLNQSNATENAIGNAGGNLTSCHMLRCSALPQMQLDLFRGATCWMASPLLNTMLKTMLKGNVKSNAGTRDTAKDNATMPKAMLMLQTMLKTMPKAMLEEC